MSGRSGSFVRDSRFMRIHVNRLRRTIKGPIHYKRFGPYKRKTQIKLLTLAVAAIPTEVAAGGVLELAVAFGADADHVGHDGAGDGFLGLMLGMLFTRHCAGRVG